MQTQVKDLNNFTKELEIIISEEEKKEFEKKAVKVIRRKAQIPGFRPGKAPEAIVKSQYTYEIANETLDQAMDKLYPQAIKDLDLPVVAPGKLKDVKNENNQISLVFDVVVEPGVELVKVKGLEVTRKTKEVTQDHINSVIEDFRMKQATIEELEEGAVNGNMIDFDIQETDEQFKAISGKVYPNLSLKLGEGKYDIDIENQLTGIKKDEKRRIVKKYPADHEKPEFRGKKEHYVITAKSVYNKELPAIDDNFASTVNESYHTVDDMLKDIREKTEAHMN